MSTDNPNPVSPTAHLIRLLRPFFLDRDAVTCAAKALTHATQAGRKRVWPLWEEAQPHDLYLHEVLDHVTEFLFGRDEGACRYLRVPAETANYWFKKGGVFRKPSADPDLEHATSDKLPSEFPAAIEAPGIELFLSPHGVGVFSITLEAKASGGERDLREFNYRLSQVRDFSVYPFHLPYAPQHQAIPAADTPLDARLGVPGGAFTLAELTKLLTKPLESLKQRWVQAQCSVYSVTRFSSAALFTDPQVKETLQPFLNALTHIEECHHVGSLAITEQVLNPRHWAAVGSLGAAHLVADQDLPHAFDTQRVPIVLHKYFIPYLLSFLQRLTLQRLVGEAREQAVKQVTSSPEGKGEPLSLAELHDLHAYMLGFNVNGYYTEVSSREVLNQYYDLAQRGLRVPQSLRLVLRTLRDAEAKVRDDEAVAANHFQRQAMLELNTLASKAGKNVKTIADVQSKVEWLEVFFVSYYATALVYYVTAKGLFTHTFASLSLILTPPISGLIAFLGLRPDRLNLSDDESPHGQTAWILIVLVLIFIIRLPLGYVFFPSGGH
jgi:hypothetical protein